MNLLMIFVFVLLPVVAGLTGPIWIRAIPSFRRLLHLAPTFDQTAVDASALPPSCTIRTLREHDHFGDTIVVTHHLRWAIEELLYSYLKTVLVGAILTLLIVFIAASMNASSTATTPPPTQPDPQTTQQVFAYVGAYYLAAPAAAILTTLVAFIQIVLVHDHVRRYRDLLQPQAP